MIQRCRRPLNPNLIGGPRTGDPGWSPRHRPRQAIAGLRAFARGELRVWPTRTLAGHAHVAAREIIAKPAAVAAARAAGQAAATAHMEARALVAAAYADKAAGAIVAELQDRLAATTD